MEPKLIEIQPFTVSGISVRTLNSDEAQPLKAKLPGLWGQFFGQGLADKTPNKVAESPVYGVYSAYESDVSGQYSVTAGVSVSKASPESSQSQLAEVGTSCSKQKAHCLKSSSKLGQGSGRSSKDRRSLSVPSQQTSRCIVAQMKLQFTSLLNRHSRSALNVVAQ